ncbi:MAG TPA: DUF4139 domain-containing protein [Sulfurovum sp.]|uniref:DUF4139 domain-containing protein n=1 Tax=Sulfurovum sp. TaxID=1969726 RepID=UPI002F95A0A6
MKFTRALTVLLLTAEVSYASSLAVYQDRTFYHFTPKDNFIGFSKGMQVRCEGRSVPLSPKLGCPQDDRLCQLLTGLKTSEQKLKAVQANGQALEKLVSIPRPAALDAKVMIDAAKEIGEAQAGLSMQESLLKEEVRLKENAFLRQAPAKQALEMQEACSKEVELVIPYGYVSFSTHYEAMIQDQNEISVTQYLSVTNRSGIDIKAQTAMFYYRAAGQYVSPVHFRPWIVRKYEPTANAASPAPLAKKAKMERAVMAEDRAYGLAPIALYEDAREYRINDLSLPSTGVPIEVEVLKWKAPVSCEVRAYPYERSKAFHICSFQPKYQIDRHEWKVRSAEAVINENAAGEYREGQYQLYTKAEEDLQIVRKKIVEKERETGIFGGTVRKKDGFTLTLTNKSDKEKSFTVIERIPTSTTEEIRSKLLAVTSEKKVDYRSLEEGKIEMKLTLAPYETKVIEVRFEISHDKELKVDY